jgi:hypothetical protein
MITTVNSKVFLHLNGERKLIGIIENGTLIKKIYSPVHTMNKTQEIGINKEMVDTLNFKDIAIWIMGKIYHTTKEYLIENARVDSYGKYEPQYFLAKDKFITI